MQASATSRPRIVVFSLGGTIAMTPGERAGVVPALSAQDLLAAIPTLDRIAHIEAESVRVYPGSETDLLSRGLLSGGFLDGAKARVMLSLLLADGADRRRVEDAFAWC